MNRALQELQSPVHADPDPLQGGCFVLMPFRQSFQPVYRAIRAAAKVAKLACWRADQRLTSGHVVRAIEDDIVRAGVVVADLTWRNPNVFYEVGFAYARKDAKSVILIAQRSGDVPFDLRDLRYHKYEDTLSGRRRLAERLTAALRDAVRVVPGYPYEAIDGRENRTLRIIRDCATLLESGSGSVRRLIIRARAGLSSLAVSDSEVTSTPPERRRYRVLLRTERDSLRSLVAAGAAFRGILSPPRQILQGYGHLQYRFERLISVLENWSGDPLDEPLRSPRCQFALSPMHSNNMLCLGDRVWYDGAKSGLRGGFECTTRVSDRRIIGPQASAFDQYFQDAKEFTLREYGRGVRRDSHLELRRAVCRGLRDFAASLWPKWKLPRAPSTRSHD